MISPMAIRNAISRIYPGAAPPTTLMTGTTTQMIMDIADLLRGLPSDQRLATWGRLSRMGANGAGCAAGTVKFSPFKMGRSSCRRCWPWCRPSWAIRDKCERSLS